MTILNGGRRKKLNNSNIQYYYDNMDNIISAIQAPLNKYTSIQKRIADCIKRIGGSGKIHGCIVDIDFLNHIYVNPTDLTITGYYAEDIMNKVAFPTVPELLQNTCPKLYNNYTNLIENTDNNPLVVNPQGDASLRPQVYLDTDIYNASLEISKMQKLYNKILTVWNDYILNKKLT